MLESPGLLLVDSGFATDTFNVALGLPSTDLDEAIVSVLEHFYERKLPFSWWVGPRVEAGAFEAVLARHGLDYAEGELAMALPLQGELPAFPAVAGLATHQVKDEQALAAYAEVLASNWVPADQAVIG